MITLILSCYEDLKRAVGSVNFVASDFNHWVSLKYNHSITKYSKNNMV
jgi:hypothetical protein